MILLLAKSTLKLIQKRYKNREFSPPTYLFVIDISFFGFDSQLIELFSILMKDMIGNDQFPGLNNARIGIIFFDKIIYLAKFSKTNGECSLVALPDSKDFYIPFIESMTVSIKDYKQCLLNLFDSLPRMFINRSADGISCLIDALNAAYEVMKDIGGRVILLFSNNTFVNEVYLIIQPGLETFEKLKKDSRNFLVPTSGLFSGIASRFQNKYVTLSIFAIANNFSVISLI